MIEERITLRKLAKKSGVSKSTIHKDMTERLLIVDPHLHRPVRDILNWNKEERAYRGGRALRKKLMRQNQ